MMNWLWIPAVTLLALFILVLCWLFFADYTCCPCRRRRRLEPALSAEDLHTVTPSAPLPGTLPQYPVLPTAPQYFPVPPSEGSYLPLKHGDLPFKQVLRFEDGILTLDLHTMTVREALQTTEAFIRQYWGQHEKVRIITGRGIHSENGVPKVKPAIKDFLLNHGLQHTEIRQGGCFEVFLSG
ncbi:uncharacterized protein [Penaeus vannamei]|uniref:Smr domain-containing protein n=1 Tax=Penaeus vannamei TaxID=6689 RepID=A0A423TUI5_PENVA|nr:uncharacterized protein LOC113813280 [Penaeus vannamei]ROT80128.1 hypothetical protein C7M84_001147 [Penaeus vannamei]